jgi:hypothetical protein
MGKSISLCVALNDYLPFDIDDNKDWMICISPEDFVNADVLGLELAAGGVPTNKLLLGIDLSGCICTFLNMMNIV